MKLTCPACGETVPAELIDLAAEKAGCARCENVWFDCSQWIHNEFTSSVDLGRPPRGAWFEETEHGFKVGVSTRSWSWIFFLPAALASTGLILFILWKAFQAGAADLGIALVALGFPLGALGAILWMRFLQRAFGRIEVQVDGGSAVIFRGVGTWGWSRRFDWNAVDQVRVSIFPRKNRPSLQQIWFETDETIVFARGLPSDRFNFMLAALRQMRRKHPPR